uniref:Glycerol-3-phosphate acyltransferase 1, mitochondrial-like n=1 Tax=Phallusia mammillata TaxID=59560 RepID=A0A6F9DD74_9ASCI|nr:glycerol-3-phosphate acyltransferase 1, mitochondrial-like [Phallusia mammillata]
MGSCENEADLFEYKKKFDQSYLDVGLKRPEMGGTHWKPLDSAGSQANMDSIDIVALSQRPFYNLLHIPGLQERDFLTKTFYYCYVTTTRRTDHRYPDPTLMRQNILSDERLHHAIQKTLCTTESSSDDVDVKQEKRFEKQMMERASMYLDEMLATVTSKALKFSGWLCLTLLRQLTSSVHLHQGQLEVLRTISEGNTPVLYLPLHFSHFDYILMTLLLYHSEIRSPFVASGNNLNIPLFRSVMRRVGGFFIRRKIDRGNEKDYIYRAVLNSYVTELLKENQSLEVFIEGTRTRSGLPNQPKTGIFSVVVESVLKGVIPDVTVVPVCVSYEKLMDGNFDGELMGQTKKPETFITSIFTIAKMACGFYGHIRVNFGAPQSLKKTIQEIQSSPSCALPLLKSLLPRSKSLYEQVTLVNSNHTFCTEAKRSRSTPSVDFPLSSPQAGVTPHLHKTQKPSSSQILEDSKQYPDDRELVTLLAERMIYNGVKCKAFMSTNIVAFLLLHHFRSGVTMPTLVRYFRHLVTDLLTRKSDIGFTGEFSEVVLHAVNLLGTRLVTLDCSSPTKQSRSSSYLSLKSRHSADSGLDIDDVPAKECSTATSSPVEQIETPDLSDSDVPPGATDHYTSNSLPTGVYMSLSESGVYDDGQLVSTTDDNLFSESDDSSIAELCPRGLSRTHRSKQNDICLFIKPVLEVPQVFELAYYSNALTPVYAMESVVALAVGAVLGFHFSVIEKQIELLKKSTTGKFLRLDMDDIPECVQKSFLRSSLQERSLELVDLLQMDLILCDVTDNLEIVVNQAIDSLLSSGCLVSHEYGVSASVRNSESARDLCFDADDVDTFSDQWLKVHLPSVLQLISKQSIMAGHVEGYMVASMQLYDLTANNLPMPELQLKQQMIAATQSRIVKATCVRAESCSSDVIMNAIRSFEWNGILVRCDPNNKSLKLTSDFEDSESICNLVSRISMFML